MHKPGSGPKGVERIHPAHITWRFVTHQQLPSAFSIQIKNAADKVGICRLRVGFQQLFQSLSMNVQAVEVALRAQVGDQFRGDQTSPCQSLPLFEESGDPLRLVDDRDLRMRIDDPLQ
jgi:hypothetical protein